MMKSFCLSFSLALCVYQDRGSSPTRHYSDYGPRLHQESCPICRYNSCHCGQVGYPSIRRDSWGYRDRYPTHVHHSTGYREPHPPKKSTSRQKEYKIVSGSVGNKTKPQGYHTLDWYKARGYNTSKLGFESRDGDRYKSSSKSSSSKKKSSSSSSKKKKKD